jgi:hypothetical protein
MEGMSAGYDVGRAPTAAPRFTSTASLSRSVLLRRNGNGYVDTI